jgi:hypothetical protein
MKPVVINLTPGYGLTGYGVDEIRDGDDLHGRIWGYEGLLLPDTLVY